MLDKLDKSISALYGAASRQAAWTEAADQISKFIGAAGGSFLVYDRTNTQKWTLCESSIGSDFRDLYFSGNIVDDSPTRDFLTRNQIGVIAASDDLMAETDFRDTRMYRDFLKPFGLGRLMSAHIARSDDHLIAAGFYRTPIQPAFDTTEKQAFSLIMKHIERALRIEGMVTSLSALNKLSLSALDQTNTAVIFVDGAGRMVGSNETGDHLLRVRALTLLDGHIRASKPDETRKLHHAIRQAGDWRIHSDAKPVVAITKPDGTSIIVEVLPAQNWIADLGSSVAVAALVIRDPSLKRASPWETIKGLFGLTPAEVRVVQAMAELEGSQPEIAEALGISVNTFKTHKLRAYQKLNVENQAALVRIVNEYSR